MRTLSLNKPHLIIMVGIPGAGKSFFAEQFAETFNAPLVSFEKIAGELLDSKENSQDQEMTAKIASYMLTELFKTRQSIIFDGYSALRSDRTVLTKFAQAAGYEVLFIWVQTESMAARQRATKGRGRSGLSNEEFDIAIEEFNTPHELEKAVVISGKHTYASQLKNVLKRLAEPRIEATQQLIVTKRSTPNGRNILIR